MWVFYNGDYRSVYSFRIPPPRLNPRLSTGNEVSYHLKLRERLSHPFRLSLPTEWITMQSNEYDYHNILDELFFCLVRGDLIPSSPIILVYSSKITFFFSLSIKSIGGMRFHSSHDCILQEYPYNEQNSILNESHRMHLDSCIWHWCNIYLINLIIKFGGKICTPRFNQE